MLKDFSYTIREYYFPISFMWILENFPYCIKGRIATKSSIDNWLSIWNGLAQKYARLRDKNHCSKISETGGGKS